MWRVIGPVQLRPSQPGGVGSGSISPNLLSCLSDKVMTPAHNSFPLITGRKHTVDQNLVQAGEHVCGNNQLRVSRVTALPLHSAGN